ncbi:MAG: discoidin domain-containing protein [Verrucomicrobiia bacterium]
MKTITSLWLITFLFSAVASQFNPNTDWFQKAGYGVFVHYLNDLQNNSNTVHSLGKQTSWDECVKEFDVERFAAAMAEAQAGYVIFTMHQRTRFLIAPNSTFDRLTGYKPGEACSTRDLVEELYQALSKRKIPLMLYWTGDGPREDALASKGLGGFKNPIPVEYVRNWASVVREYGERYGEKVKGWWVDGCYSFIGYDEERLGILAAALKAGNTNRIIALNPGVQNKVGFYTIYDDYTCGEQNNFYDIPTSRWINGVQWHILSFLGCGNSKIGAAWAMPGVKYQKSELIDYVADVNQAGGVVSIDILLFRDGSVDRSQLEVLKALRPDIAASKAKLPVPPGNLAFRKPSKLLSLDGERELPANSEIHFPRLGVDGKLNTYAQAAGEWAWTYEVDLLKPYKIRRIKVNFGKGFATTLRISVSENRKEWKQVAYATSLEGKPFECQFEPTAAEYVRVSAIKPDGENQKGSQMSIAELEVYEE